MVARICSLEIRRDLLNDARPNSSAYKTITEMFPHAPLLPWPCHLMYSVPDLDEDLNLELQLCLELESLLMPSLITFSFDAKEPSSDIILESLASTCPGIRMLIWKRPCFTIHLPHLLLRFLMLHSLDVSSTKVTNKNINIISRSCLMSTGINKRWLLPIIFTGFLEIWKLLRSQD